VVAVVTASQPPKAKYMSVAVCCSVLQQSPSSRDVHVLAVVTASQTSQAKCMIACRVLQCVAVFCSVLQPPLSSWVVDVLAGVAAFAAALCGSVLQCVAAPAHLQTLRTLMC